MSRPATLLRRAMMELSGLRYAGPTLVRVAGLFLGPYKDKRVLAYITAKPYVSPAARIKCRGMTLGANSFIDELVTIYVHDGEGAVHIGKRTHIYRGTNIEVGQGAKAVIGDDTHIQGPCDIKAFGWDLRIGSEVQIAPFCALSSYDHGFARLDLPIQKQELTGRGETVIGNDVWLGAGVKVLAGVRIGDGSVIGAGSVVSRDIPPYAIAVGVPAGVVRRRDAGHSLAKGDYLEA